MATRKVGTRTSRRRRRIYDGPLDEQKGQLDHFSMEFGEEGRCCDFQAIRGDGES